MTCKI